MCTEIISVKQFIMLIKQFIMLIKRPDLCAIRSVKQSSKFKLIRIDTKNIINATGEGGGGGPRSKKYFLPVGRSTST